MSTLNNLLKVLEKFGYPNEDFKSLASMAAYESDEFLLGLYETLGDERTFEFIGKTFNKLSEGDKGIFVPLWREGEYVYLIIENFNVDFEEGYCVFIDWTWGDNKVMDDNDKLTTLQAIDEDNDPWDLDDFYDGLKEVVGDHISRLTGFDICWGI